MNSLVLPSPAKLNLFLHILGRRPDGYHELQTLFQFLNYGDTLTLTARTDGRIVLEQPLPGVPDEENLIVRAARQLAATAGHTTPGVSIAVDKQLPMGGGLGGGSSNAATTLVGLNRLWGLNRSLDELAELGLSLGADVPVFVRGHAAWGEGVGERLTDANPPEDWFLVIKPPCDISTKEIFSEQGLTRDTPGIKIAPAFEGDASRYRNDCEDVVRRLYPEVHQSLEWLAQFGPARLTGTGACIFGRFPTESAARIIWESKPSGITGFVAQGVNISPLHKKLTELK
ncbi:MULTISPECIES: 4-(cytidine 5'-diphospho)-2-C-methyl-D-erythritol kinase [Marinobacter]|uniref:4-diphosphocytidyl-2-C-methyl-D-erythritol kinase n=2 Tax=Marinobacter salarius TaxID=1420917 RepID=A0A1W6KCV3_9GAMM|nr:MULTISPECIES: 4-(cytidine 5'-diphospho)-2-C-methyl-D-erythritol kinase [Marinobacter]ARM85248.1 4-diphosphocytidyl-2-C-methyl-D-erythritol kinase [Marinobacter salarius]MBJ7301346.1 4-(cytidine 5'-diphospho)-2-C-methyl-D-erythritol kinase [Marinobacter salarius]MCC4284543.1 4-(cytidine 5'-diphospho)-2-C-methyl-D-erythritol kinase [Marinobacter salarius]MCZ4284920.1 4-(cytidine 5'-diphospho)-2-C-methyl-D-erythritol kinase [Marinobacter salarius]MDC8455174.1 4-(cytidine 5'-diphospho)-2-C-meth